MALLFCELMALAIRSVIWGIVIGDIGADSTAPAFLLGFDSGYAPMLGFTQTGIVRVAI